MTEICTMLSIIIQFTIIINCTNPELNTDIKLNRSYSLVIEKYKEPQYSMPVKEIIKKYFDKNNFTDKKIQKFFNKNTKDIIINSTPHSLITDSFNIYNFLVEHVWKLYLINEIVEIAERLENVEHFKYTCDNKLNILKEFTDISKRYLYITELDNPNILMEYERIAGEYLRSSINKFQSKLYQFEASNIHNSEKNSIGRISNISEISDMISIKSIILNLDSDTSSAISNGSGRFILNNLNSSQTVSNSVFHDHAVYNSHWDIYNKQLKFKEKIDKQVDEIVQFLKDDAILKKDAK